MLVFSISVSRTELKEDDLYSKVTLNVICIMNKVVIISVVT